MSLRVGWGGMEFFVGRLIYMDQEKNDVGVVHQRDSIPKLALCGTS